MKYNTVIVTGGAGFIGSHLVDRLVDQANRVIVIDKAKPSKEKKNKRAIYKRMDIREEDVVNVFKKEQPDVLFHLAAHLLDRVSIREPIENAQNNIIGSLRVFEGMRRYGKGKIVFSSSCAIYGNQESLPVRESFSPAPETPYAISKRTDELYLAFYHRMHQMPYTALRFGNVYGPRQDSSVESGAISIFTSKLLRGEVAVMNNDGETTRDYVYVDDIVDALMASAESSFVGSLNIGTGIALSTKDLFTRVKEAVGVQSVPDRREDVPDLLKRMYLDASKAQTEIGWSPKTSFEQGLAKTVAWYREHV